MWDASAEVTVWNALVLTKLTLPEGGGAAAPTFPNSQLCERQPRDRGRFSPEFQASLPGS
jgi:hypothetical protein